MAVKPTSCVAPSVNPGQDSPQPHGGVEMNDLVLPDDYLSILDGLKQKMRATRYQAQRTVNTELVQLCWQIGRVLTPDQ